MKLPPQTPGTVPQGRLIDPRSPDQREGAICAQVSDLITSEDVQGALSAIRRALKATTTIRAPKKKDAPTKNNYMIVDDVPTQLAAARLLFAYKFGNPASVLEMKLTAVPGVREPMSRDQMIEQLRSSGTDMNAIVNTWMNAAKKVGEDGALPADLQDTVKAVEKLKVVDV